MLKKQKNKKKTKMKKVNVEQSDWNLNNQNLKFYLR